MSWLSTIWEYTVTIVTFPYYMIYHDAYTPQIQRPLLSISYIPGYSSEEPWEEHSDLFEDSDDDLEKSFYQTGTSILQSFSKSD